MTLTYPYSRKYGLNLNSVVVYINKLVDAKIYIQT